jgi:hypothetical protein
LFSRDEAILAPGFAVGIAVKAIAGMMAATRAGVPAEAAMEAALCRLRRPSPEDRAAARRASLGMFSAAPAAAWGGMPGGVTEAAVLLAMLDNPAEFVRHGLHGSVLADLAPRDGEEHRLGFAVLLVLALIDSRRAGLAGLDTGTVASLAAASRPIGTYGWLGWLVDAATAAADALVLANNLEEESTQDVRRLLAGLLAGAAEAFANPDGGPLLATLVRSLAVPEDELQKDYAVPVPTGWNRDAAPPPDSALGRLAAGTLCAAAVLRRCLGLPGGAGRDGPPLARS